MVIHLVYNPYNSTKSKYLLGAVTTMSKIIVKNITTEFNILIQDSDFI